MASWIYIFSRFTPEALLFEALAICVLCASYAAFWVLRKRKYGVLGANAPAYAVKSYLSQLIIDAEQMRIQLFGLLAGTGAMPAGGHDAAWRSAAGAAAGSMISPLTGAPSPSAAALAADPELGSKMIALESKMIEQNKAIETILADKARLEKDLADARGGKPAAPGSAAAAGDPKLAEKIQLLEAKLAEYSVIEDDLANLKRLQQENAQLKAQLGGGKPAEVAQPVAGAPAAGAGATAAGVAAPVLVEPTSGMIAETPLAAAAASPDAAVAETAMPATVEEVGKPQAAADAAITEPAAAAAAAEAAAAAAAAASIAEAAKPAEAIASPTADPNFEGLVDQVEQSLADPAAAAAAKGGAGATAKADAGKVEEANNTQAAASRAAAAPAEKSDADLVAEFEKMLNS